MRGFLILSAMALTACASGGVMPAGPELQTVRGGSAVAGQLTITSNSSANVNEIYATVDKVWKVLPAAFDSLGVTVASVDPATHSIGNEGYKLRQRLGGVPLSRYLDCGAAQVGANADSYEIFLTAMAVAQASKTPGATTLSIMVEATAKPLAFAQAPSRCSTTGELESRLVKAVKAQLPK